MPKISGGDERQAERRTRAARHRSRMEDPCSTAQGSRPRSTSCDPARDEQSSQHRQSTARMQRLDQQLRDQLASAGAERQPDGELPRSRYAAGEQQVRDVGARDQHDDAGDAEQQRRTPESSRRDSAARRVRRRREAVFRARNVARDRCPFAARLSSAAARSCCMMSAEDAVERTTAAASRVMPGLSRREQIQPVVAAAVEIVVAGVDRGAHRQRHEDVAAILPVSLSSLENRVA